LLAGLAAGGAAGAAEQLAAIAAGDSIVAVAYAASTPGRFRNVLDGDVADVFLLVGTHTVALARAADLTVTARGPFDLTRGLADVVADVERVPVIADGDTARETFRSALIAARLALAADSAGGAQAALRDAVEYARGRIQFGRPIGGFQAIKHILADRYVDAELALSVARLAIEAHVEGAPDAAQHAALAAFYCAEKYSAVAADDIQVHGGVGFTAEYAAHLYRRRADSNRLLLGAPAELRADYMTTMIGGREL
ncbi:acyl-CoA dehydrogenase family protein, partial [Tsukamurella soli]